MRVLVTGSSGHLGEALVRTLRERGSDVIGLDIRPSQWTNVIGSVTDAGLASEAKARPSRCRSLVRRSAGS